MYVSVCVSVCGCVCDSLHEANESVTLLVNALYDLNVIKTNSCAHLNATGKQMSMYLV